MTYKSQEEREDHFKKVLENNKGLIYKVARSYTSDNVELQDLIQEIFLQIWNSLHRYDKSFALSTWLYRICLNVSISHYRRGGKMKKVKDAEAIYLKHVQDDIRKDSVDNVQLLYDMIGGLKEIDRAITILYLEEKSHKEISDILGMSTTNVATRIGRIKKELKYNYEQNLIT